MVNILNLILLKISVTGGILTTQEDPLFRQEEVPFRRIGKGIEKVLFFKRLFTEVEKIQLNRKRVGKT